MPNNVHLKDGIGSKINNFRATAIHIVHSNYNTLLNSKILSKQKKETSQTSWKMTIENKWERHLPSTFVLLRAFRSLTSLEWTKKVDTLCFNYLLLLLILYSQSMQQSHLMTNLVNALCLLTGDLLNNSIFNWPLTVEEKLWPTP